MIADKTILHLEPIPLSKKIKMIKIMWLTQGTLMIGCCQINGASHVISRFRIVKQRRQLSPYSMKKLVDEDK
jgi:hypothetical protein